MFGKRKAVNAPYNDIMNEDILKPGELSTSQKITVGVAGVCTRIGATTQAIQIAEYLFYSGRKVAYVEMNGSGFLDALLRRYQEVTETKDGNLIYNRLTLVKKDNIRTVLGPEYDYLVFDYGSVRNKNFDRLSFAERNIQVLVAGSSPDEIDFTTAALSDPSFNRCRLLFSFVPEDDRQAVESMMSGRKGDTYFTAYTPDRFVSDASMDAVYRQILP